MIDDFDLDDALRHVDRLTPADKQRVLELIDRRDRLKRVEEAREHFLPFVKLMWPDFIPGAHHTIMAEAFEEVAAGRLNRLIINMPPRFTKSEFTSWLLPAWFLGRYPKKKIIQASNTEALAAGFGRRVRNLISGASMEEDNGSASIPYSEVFPRVELAKDSQSAAGWHTNRGGEYFAIGVNGKVTGKGADCAYFDAKCLTKRGYIRIADIKVGDQVLGYDHATQQNIWTRVRAISTQLKPALVNINGFLCTPDHRVYTRRGYRRAMDARTDDDQVLSLQQGVYEERQGIPAPDPARRQTAYTPVLFGNVPAKPGYVQMPGVRRLESPDGNDLQGLLSERQAHAAGMQALRQTDPTPEIRAGQERSLVRRYWQRLLRSWLLPRILRQSSASSNQALWRGRRVRDVQGPGYARRWEILFAEVLPGTSSGPERGQAVHGGMEPRARASEEAVQGGVRGMRESESSSASASRGSRCYEPCENEPGAAVRAMPRVLSSDRDGASARDFEGALRGDGYWVVDIQTDKGNFYCDNVLVHNCLIVDDPHSEQEARQAETSPEIFDSVYEWYTSGPRQRLQPGGAIIIVMTRWSKRDLTGQVLKKQAAREPGDIGDEWKVIDFPAILDEGEPTERSLWPAFWPLPALKATKAELPVPKWKAQYQQKPTSEEGAIIKREAWRRWGHDPDPTRSMCPSPAHQDNWRDLKPPACSFIMMSIDTALKKTERADYSAFTTWGVFEVEDRLTGKVVNNLILLSAWKARLEFPELKRTVRQFYREDQPDAILIEDKGSGTSLIQELRAMDIPVENFSYGRGKAKGTGMSNDKVSRANMITDIFASGYVWAPERRFADECIEECAEFPNGDHDDYVDTVVQALLRFRSGGFIRTMNDVDDGDEDEAPHRRRKYY